MPQHANFSFFRQIDGAPEVAKKSSENVGNRSGPTVPAQRRVHNNSFRHQRSDKSEMSGPLSAPEINHARYRGWGILERSSVVGKSLQNRGGFRRNRIVDRQSGVATRKLIRPSYGRPFVQFPRAGHIGQFSRVAWAGIAPPSSATVRHPPTDEQRYNAAKRICLLFRPPRQR